MRVNDIYRASSASDPQSSATWQAGKRLFKCKSRSHDLPIWRPGISGRSSFQDDQSQVAYCGALFCVGGTTADGFTRNTQRALASKNTLHRRARFSRKRPPRTQGEGCGFECVAVFWKDTKRHKLSPGNVRGSCLFEQRELHFGSACESAWRSSSAHCRRLLGLDSFLTAPNDKARRATFPVNRFHTVCFNHRDAHGACQIFGDGLCIQQRLFECLDSTDIRLRHTLLDRSVRNYRRSH